MLQMPQSQRCTLQYVHQIGVKANHRHQVRCRGWVSGSQLLQQNLRALLREGLGFQQSDQISRCVRPVCSQNEASEIH